VIRGSDNPLARAASHSRPTQHLLAAAAHDLEVLQQLAVLERTLAGWVRHTAYGLDERWLEAAASLAPPEGGEQRTAPELLLPAAPPPALLAPLSEAQRAGLRAELAGKWKWSEGVEVRGGQPLLARAPQQTTGCDGYAVVTLPPPVRCIT
jgi:hypothetical protein